ncbi:flippase, partial [Caballeronia sp. BR00000012568055]|uniref:flippase n=1 Tax=Caballeronia sp. BR00000012568055 TaxID=2918761 RepID=UPI0023F95286
MAVAFIANYAASFATFPYLTRVLGPTHFGVLAYALAIAAYGVMLTEWGISLSGPRAVVACRDDNSRLNALIWSVLGAKALLYVAATVLLFALLAFSNFDKVARTALLTSWIGVLANVCTMNWLFQGLERFKIISAMLFVSRAVTLPLTFWLVVTPDDLAIAAAIQTAGPLCGALLSIWIARRDGLLHRPVVTWSAITKRLTESVDMFVATASVTLFGAANAIILTSLCGSYAAGIYAGADKIRTVCSLIPAQLGTVLYPRIAATLKKRASEAARLTVLGAVIITVVSVCGAVITITFSEQITAIVLGRHFHDASQVLRMLALSTMFGNLAYFLGLQVLVPWGRSKLRTSVIFATGCLNVVLAIALAQRYAAMGASISFLACEVSILIAYVVLILKDRRLRRFVSLGARAVMTEGRAYLDSRRLFHTPEHNPIRVLHVGPGWGQRGGIASVLDELKKLSAAFATQDVRIRFCATHDFRSPVGVLLFLIVDVPNFVLQLMRGVEIVHLHVSIKGSFHRKLILFLISRVLRKRVVFHLHSGDFPSFIRRSTRLVAVAARRFLRNSAGLVGVSSAIGAEIIA